jgi:dTMP kinase
LYSPESKSDTALSTNWDKARDLASVVVPQGGVRDKVSVFLNIHTFQTGFSIYHFTDFCDEPIFTCYRRKNMTTAFIDGGFFVSLEGPEGVGKSTQAHLLAEALRADGYYVCETREPGGTALGEELRRLVKHLGGEHSPCPEAELLIMGASRAQLVRQVIMPCLEKGGVVICDRFADSTTVYQGCGRGLDPVLIREMHRVTTLGRMPDLTLVLDLDLHEGLRRSQVRAGENPVHDRFESESLAFHEKVRNGFLTLAADNPERVRIVAGGGTAAAVHTRILEIVHHALA